MLTSLPGITGFTSTYDNIGQTSNKGIEFSLSGVIFENKDWNITAGMNINFNKGKVDKLAENVTGYMALVGVAVAVSRVRIIFYRKVNLWVWSEVLYMMAFILQMTLIM